MDRTATPDGGLWEAVVACAGVGVFLTDLEGRITEVNPRAATLLGRGEATLRGADAHQTLHRRPDGTVPPRAGCELSRVVRQGETVRGDFATFACADGRLLPVEWLASPLHRDGELTGVVVVFTDIVERMGEAGRQAEQLAKSQAQTEQLAMITEITTVLTQTLDMTEAMRRLGRLLVPRLADWAAVDVWLGPRELRRVAVEARGGQELDPSWCGPLPPLPAASRSPLVRVLRGQEGPLLLGPDEIAARPDAPLAAAHHVLFSVLGGRSAIVAPLCSARRVLGALTVARTGSAYGPADVELIADIARSAGMAADNASLFGQQRDIVETMQRHLLTALPQVDHLQLAARYLAAPLGSQVGGDWYDAFLLPDGATAMAIGDVAGHDLEAAGQMAQLRNMLRALAWDHHEEPPSAVLDRFNHVMAGVSDAPTASVVLARVEAAPPDGWLLRWASAGHLPPLLVTADGQSRYLEAGQGLLLGIHLDEDGGRPDACHPMPPGSTLLMYTDGLVEIPGAHLDAGLMRLRHQAAMLATHPVEVFCDQIVSRAPSPRADDIALLALRLPATV
ncbi:SpoIIE family protein phosphatase [Nonomuraea sp. NN258]|uniref:SpoIIE family protein phosphatase n=1 Tax=Nonomuraea antri TaxID=2730852 RepID=UPI00156A656B|nr:SpoIIE family protein phosphatase [Nonomuraea antri]NRQ33650.1 SpoIIE family protein phosphatase [Nonomuraea antri]